jgi:hypothetical protein
MRLSIRFLCTMTLAGIMEACTSQSPRSSHASAESPPVSASQTQTKATSTSGAKSSVVNAELIRQGYRPVKKEDQILYCRREQVTGTNFKTNVCLTEAQVAEQQKQARQTADEMSRSRTGPACPRPPCGI